MIDRSFLCLFYRIVKAFEELNARKAAATKQRKDRQETKKKKVKRI